MENHLSKIEKPLVSQIFSFLISKLNKWLLKSRPFDIVFTYSDKHHTPHTYEYIDNVYIHHTLEETKERVLDNLIEVPETHNPSPKPILVQLPNNY